MTQHASEQIQATLLAQDLRDQNITLLALKNSAQTCTQRLAQALEKQGIPCSWIWYPDCAEADGCKTGTAFLCVDREIRCVDRFPINKGTDTKTHNVHTALGIQIEGMEDWFYCLSLDPSVAFQSQWKLLNGCIAAKRLCSTVWLLGMQSCRAEMPFGNWMEAADGEIWCSRKREIHFCANEKGPKSYLCTKGAAVIEVKE